MVPVMNMPFLERTLRRLKDAGIDDVILPAGYLPDAITSYFGDGSELGLRLRYVIEEIPLGTAGALKNVEQFIDGPFFVLNGDVLTSLDLRAMLAFHRAKGGIGTIHLIHVDDPSPFGAVVHDAAGRIQQFVEKPPRETAPTNEINAGTYLLEREVLDRIPAGRPVSIERETFPELIAAGGRGALRLHHRRLLDRPRQARGVPRRAPRHLRRRRCRWGSPRTSTARAARRSPPRPSGRRSSSAVGCRVAPDAVVGPYTVLGDGCEVGSGAVVLDSLLWDEVVVERRTRTSRRPSSPAAPASARAPGSGTARSSATTPSSRPARRSPRTHGSPSSADDAR